MSARTRRRPTEEQRRLNEATNRELARFSQNAARRTLDKCCPPGTPWALPPMIWSLVEECPDCKALVVRFRHQIGGHEHLLGLIHPEGQPRGRAPQVSEYGWADTSAEHCCPATGGNRNGPTPLDR